MPPLPQGQDERRTYHGVRAIFEEAYVVALPYLDPAQGILGQPLTHHVSIVLHENFPQLSNQERAVLIGALQATFKIRSRQM